MERWSTTGLYGVDKEPSLSIKFLIHILRRTYSPIQLTSKRLESIINEHFCLVHPDAKSLKPKIKRRKLIASQLAKYIAKRNFKSTFFVSSNIVHVDICYSNLVKVMAATMTNCSFLFSWPPLVLYNMSCSEANFDQICNMYTPL